MAYIFGLLFDSSKTNTASSAWIQVTNDSLPATKGKAVFTQYGDHYFLRGVWVAGKASHLLCNTPKVERHSLIAAGETSTAVEVALLREGR